MLDRRHAEQWRPSGGALEKKVSNSTELRYHVFSRVNMIAADTHIYALMTHMYCTGIPMTPYCACQVNYLHSSCDRLHRLQIRAGGDRSAKSINKIHHVSRDMSLAKMIFNRQNRLLLYQAPSSAFQYLYVPCVSSMHLTRLLN